MRPVDADALTKAIRTDYFEHFTQYHDTDQIALIDMACNDIEESPTVDAVPVVRCRKCKHKTEYFNSGKFVCKMKQCVVCGCVVGYIKDDDFCSYGERKDGDGNG